MALVFADRVRETTSTAGTGTFSLLGAVNSCQSFSAIGNGNTTYYTAVSQIGTEWEVGLGTYNAGTLTRDTILSSSNGGAIVNFSAGTKDVFCDYPAGKAVLVDGSGNTYAPNIGGTTASAATFTNGTLKGTGQNFFLYSEQFQQAAWFQSGASVVANDTTAPNGTVTADKFTGNVGILARKSIFQPFTPINGPKYTFSVYLKAAERTTATIWLDSTGWVEGTYYGAAALLDLSTGVSSIPSQVSMTAVGNGWYRCAVTGTSSSNSSCNAAIAIGPANGGDYTGNGVSGIYAWGAQVELAATAGAYLVTTTAGIYGTPTLSFSGVAGLGLQSDGSLYVQPAGIGALQAAPTTSTIAGGNIRGGGAVDWQIYPRTAASQVASGFTSNIAGGYQNTASGGVSGVLSGTQNTAAGAVTVIAGGIGNGTALSNYGNSYSFVGSGYTNGANGVFNFVGGGFTNSGTSASAVTTQSATMNATTAVTLSGSNASIKVGQIIAGTSITNFPPTYVAAVSGTSLTLSQAASGSSTSTLSFYTPHGAVVSGGNNQATGSYSFIGGGGDAGTAANRNVASGDWSTVGGGTRNTASGIGSFVGGGGTFGGGIIANNASGTATSVVGGVGNTASGFISFVGGGSNNTANGTASSICGGNAGTVRSISGNLVFPACDTPVSATVGSSQAALLVLGKQTTDATPTVLCSNASVAGTLNQVILPNNSAYYFKGSVIANVTGAANGAAWSFEGAIMRGANAASTVLINTVSVNRVAASAGAVAWTIALTADTTNGGLAVTVTGAAATTIRWVAKVETTEVTY